MKREAEMGAVSLSVKEPWKLVEAGEARKGAPLETPEGAWPCRWLDFELLASGAVRALSQTQETSTAVPFLL